ncbi:glycosyltransferase family 2 protein [bacterium]|nr:MAG: glycosyltransferase family 2 protein [bacterium]
MLTAVRGTTTNIPVISVIIITHNSEKFIRLCLDSVFKQGCSGLEIIFIDNGSEDRTAAIIRDTLPGIMLIENPVNLGAAEARNQGIKLARGEWILTLDCDIILEENFLSNIIKIIDQAPSGVGMLQPKILNLDKKRIYSCGIHLSWSRRFYDIGSQKRDRGQFNKPREIFGPCSAAALYRRKMLEELIEDTGYFDRRFFFLVEDVDLAWRAKIRHWKCMQAPKAVCYHHGNSSLLNKKYRQYLNLRNRYFTIIKNDGRLRYFSKILPFVLYDLPRLCYLILTNRFLREALFKNTGSKNQVPKLSHR